LFQIIIMTATIKQMREVIYWYLRFSQRWLWRVRCSSSETWCHVVREKFADVSEGYIVSSFRVKYVLSKERGRTKQHIESATNNGKPYVFFFLSSTFSFSLHTFMHLYMFVNIYVYIFSLSLVSEGNHFHNYQRTSKYKVINIFLLADEFRMSHCGAWWL
jgi:hypothetical protein